MSLDDMAEVESLDLDLHPVPGEQRPAVLVLPGGGFREHTLHDGTGYAHWLNSLGIGAVVLRYRLRPDRFPLALQQARSALTALQRARLLPGTDPAQVGVIGSSAGGLLAGLLATRAVLSVEESPHRVSRPAFHIQSYGIADLALLPEPAVTDLLGEAAHLARELSPLTHIDEHTTPTFVWATANDGPGFPNALAWAHGLASADVPVEPHVYPEGGHGLGLANGIAYGSHGQTAIPHTAQWTRGCHQWLRHRGVLAS